MGYPTDDGYTKEREGSSPVKWGWFRKGLVFWVMVLGTWCIVFHPEDRIIVDAGVYLIAGIVAAVFLGASGENSIHMFSRNKYLRGRSRSRVPEFPSRMDDGPGSSRG